MFEKLKVLFGRYDPLIRALQTEDIERIMISLRRSELLFLALPRIDESGIDPQRWSSDEALEQIRNTLKDVKERDSFVPFCYDRDTLTCMPLFTDEEHATNFVQMYAVRKQRILTFQVLSADAPKVIPTFKNCDLVAFNDGSSDEYLISQAQISKLISIFE